MSFVWIRNLIDGVSVITLRRREAKRFGVPRIRVVRSLLEAKMWRRKIIPKTARRFIAKILRLNDRCAVATLQTVSAKKFRAVRQRIRAWILPDHHAEISGDGRGGFVIQSPAADHTPAIGIELILQIHHFLQCLKIRPGELVVDLVRIRLADGSPFSLEHARFPAQRFSGLLELPLGGSVYEMLGEHFGAAPEKATERIEVKLASADEASILEVEPGAPLFAITRTAADADGEPIEFARDLFRADRTRIVVKTEGPHVSAAASGRARVVELHAQAAG